MKTELNKDIATALAALQGKQIEGVYLVACGGSLSIMHPGKYFLDRKSKSLSADVYNGDEFAARAPARLGVNSLVILCSQTGTTKETTRAAQFARSRGAITIGMTLDPHSPLGTSVDHVVGYQASYTTGVPIDAADSNYGVLYMLLAGLVRQIDHVDVIDSLLKSLSHLQPAIDKAHEKFAPLFAQYAPVLANKKAVYSVASGLDYGAAYSFSICVLMPMQRTNSHAIHANEYFHGPFEVTDKKVGFVALLGLDETRHLEERAAAFAVRFASAENVLILDASTLDLAGIEEEFKSYLVPLVFFDTLWRFAYRVADLRGIPMLEGRRYMKKLSDY